MYGRRLRLPIFKFGRRRERRYAAYFLNRAFVGQSFGFASELPLGPELALPPMNHREFCL
jgi:hypothetical protein